MHESDVANSLNLAAGPVENVPEHKTLEAEQGLGHRCRWTLSIWLLPANPMLLMTNIELEKE